MKKAVWFLTLVLILAVALPIGRVSAATTVVVFMIGSTQYTVDQQTITMDAAPYIKDNRTFLPLRFVANALGIPDADITYDDATQKITIVNGAAMTVKLSIGSTYLFVNGTPTTMDVAPEIIAGRTFLPISWIAQALGFTATWDPAAQTVSLVSSSTVSSPANSGGTIVPSQKVVAGTASESEDYKWNYDGMDYTWHVEIPEALLSFSQTQTAQVETCFQQTNGTTQQNILASSTPQLQSMIQECYPTASYGDYPSWTTEPQNTGYIKQLATDLDTAAKTSGYDYFDEAEFVLSFVGGAIPYKINSVFTPQLPVQTLFNGGVCTDKSILYASLLEALGYKVALLAFTDASDPNQNQTGMHISGHEAVGVSFTDQQLLDKQAPTLLSYSINGVKYEYAETTAPGWKLGEDALLSKLSLSSAAFVYPLN